MRFSGAKLALFIGPLILTCQRDDRDDIPWPGFWDLPGGGREGGEGPKACVLRETREEFGLRVPAARIGAGRPHRRGPGRRVTWLFAAHLPRMAAARIRFGDEGQGWCLMQPVQFVRNPRAIPHLRAHVAACLRARREKLRGARRMRN